MFCVQIFAIGKMKCIEFVWLGLICKWGKLGKIKILCKHISALKFK